MARCYNKFLFLLLGILIRFDETEASPGISSSSLRKNKNKTEEELKISELTARTFPDVFDEVFKSLNTKDLSRARQVSRLWNEEAKREFNKREIQVLELGTDPFRVPDNLRVLTAMSLIFSDGPSLQTVDRMIAVRRQTLPDSLAFIQVHGLAVNSAQTRSAKNRTLGIFIPDIQEESVRAFSRHLPCIWPLTIQTEVIRRMFDSLLSGARDRNLFIFFREIEEPTFMAEWHDPATDRIMNEILQILNERVSDTGLLAVWGASVGKMAWNHIGYHLYSSWIDGKNVNSYSVSLDLELPLGKRIEKLREFEKFVVLGQWARAFAIVPVPGNEQFNTSMARTEDFRTVFPRLKLVTILNDARFAVFTADSHTKGRAQQLWGHVAYLIMTK